MTGTHSTAPSSIHSPESPDRKYCHVLPRQSTCCPYVHRRCRTIVAHAFLDCFALSAHIKSASLLDACQYVCNIPWCRSNHLNSLPRFSAAKFPKPGNSKTRNSIWIKTTMGENNFHNWSKIGKFQIKIKRYFPCVRSRWNRSHFSFKLIVNEKKK